MIDTIVTMGGSAVLGFVLKFMDNIRADKAKEREFLIGAHERKEDSMNAASARGGIWMRRFVVFVLIALYAYIATGAGEPTNIIAQVPGASYLWGLYQESPETIINTVNGAIMDDTLRTSILAIISFLFGQDSAR